MSGDMGEIIRGYVEAVLKAEVAEIERACEEALQGGECGVLVTRRRDGSFVSAGPSLSVPYGYVYETTTELPS